MESFESMTIGLCASVNGRQIGLATAEVLQSWTAKRAGEIIHTHTGANKTKLENFIRDNCTPEESSALPQMLYPE